MSVNTLQPRKNYRRLIQAYAQLTAQLDEPYTLVIVGSKGWHYEEIFAEIKKQGVGERVHFPGFVADADLPLLYSAASLLAYPSLYEGFGLPILEAMACGTPVVASNQSSMPEVVGEAGLLVDPREVEQIVAAMRQVLQDQDLQNHFIQAGLRQAQKFSWQVMAQQLWALYQKICEE